MLLCVVKHIPAEGAKQGPSPVGVRVQIQARPGFGRDLDSAFIRDAGNPTFDKSGARVADCGLFSAQLEENRGSGYFPACGSSSGLDPPRNSRFPSLKVILAPLAEFSPFLA